MKKSRRSKSLGVAGSISAQRTLSVFGTMIGTLFLCLGTAYSSVQTNVTPAQYLASQPKPNFAPAYHLPQLTRWGWTLSSNATIELANNWGYELTLSGYATPTVASNLTKPGTFDYTMAQLVKTNPAKYKLSVLIDRTFSTPIPNDFWVTNSSGLFVDTQLDTWQSATNTSYAKVISPEGNPTYWTNATAYWVSELQVIRSNVPISIILNGGEYGLDVPAGHNNVWAQDPRVQAATPGPLNSLSWPTYGSNKKAWEIDLLSAAVRQALPDRQLYIYYSTYTESARTYPTVWYDWWGFNSMTASNCTDLPSYQSYYQNYAGAMSTNSTSGIATFDYDLLTQYLNCVGFHFSFGEPLSYNWVCSGWFTNMSTHSSIPLYMGFLKCCYTAGMVGGVAGYFTYTTGGFDASFPSNSPPDWLCQMQALSHVHALFTHLEPFLTNGNLLPGPNHHAMSTDQPAYEFTSRVGLGSNDRVLVRQLNNSNIWLACAWAADGINTNVTVIIPTLGSVTLLARDCGAVYQLSATNITLIDSNGLLPSASFSTALTPPTNLRVISGNGN